MGGICWRNLRSYTARREAKDAAPSTLHQVHPLQVNRFPNISARHSGRVNCGNQVNDRGPPFRKVSKDRRAGVYTQGRCDRFRERRRLIHCGQGRHARR